MAHMGDRRCAHRVLVRRPEEMEDIRHRWEDNIKMVLQEVGWEAWNGLGWLSIGTGGRL